jgi:hypothetical protein
LSPPRVTIPEPGWIWTRSENTISWLIDYTVHSGYEVEITNAGIVTLYPLIPPDIRTAEDIWLEQLSGGSMAESEPAF